MTLKDFYADQILEFIRKYAPDIIEKAKALGGNPKQTVKKFILKHMDFKTIVVLWDKGDIIAVCNFNVDNDTADVKNCVIHPAYRFKNVLKQMTLTALRYWPSLRKLTFRRALKSNKETREINIAQFLKISNLV